MDTSTRPAPPPVPINPVAPEPLAKDDREVKSGAEDEGEVQLPGVDRRTRRLIYKQLQRAGEQGYAKGRAESAGVQAVAEKLVEANHRLATVLKAMMVDKLNLSRVEVDGKAVFMLVRTGADLNSKFIDDLVTISGMPVVVVGLDSDLSSLSVEAVEKLGWTKLGPRAAPEPAAAPEGQGA